MKQPAWAPPRQPLISRAMKWGLMAEVGPFGNAEPWNRVHRLPPDATRASPRGRSQGKPKGKRKMTISVHSIARSAHSSSSRALRWISAAAVVAVMAIPGTADAGAARAGAYDGTWNVQF